MNGREKSRKVPSSPMAKVRRGVCSIFALILTLYCPHSICVLLTYVLGDSNEISPMG
jgi:hypothetical protein